MSKQKGVALLVALVALIVLTVIGVATIGGALTQTVTIRNEQFRQQVFYAASSEINAQINTVNNNDLADTDEIVEGLLDSSVIGTDMSLQLGTAVHPLLTQPDNVTLQQTTITGDRADNVSCDGESVGKVKVIRGRIAATARLNDGKPNGGIRSRQIQRFVYCWP